VEGSCELGNEPLGSIKCWEVLGVAAELAASQEVLSSMMMMIMMSPITVDFSCSPRTFV
jgi:hypothetical protein